MVGSMPSPSYEVAQDSSRDRLTPWFEYGEPIVEEAALGTDRVEEDDSVEGGSSAE